VAGVVALLVVVVAIAVAVARRDAASVAQALPKSVAVLTLVNVSNDTANQYFVDGTTDEITAALTRVPGLRVASRSAASNIDTRKPLDQRQVAAQLNVAALLEGRLRREGDRMRLSMQLTKASDGLSLWSETYERELKDAFKVQEDIARSIAAALSVKLNGNAPPLVVGTGNPEAHDLVLVGRYRGSLYTERSLREAASLFERAIALDSNYVDAWAGLAGVWGGLADDFVPANEAAPHTRRAVERAMALDSHNPSAIAQLAALKAFYDRDFAAADRLFREVFAADSTHWAASLYAVYLNWTGHGDSAAAVLRRLQRNDPLNRFLSRFGTWILIDAGHVAEAGELCRRAIELDSTTYGDCRPFLLMRQGKYEGLLDEFRRRGDHLRVAELLGRMGRHDEAKREARVAEEMIHGHIRPITVAIAWAWAGDADRAMFWLDREERENGSGLASLAFEPELDPLRKDPRFQAMVKRVAPH
jgi:TolB-like protein